MGAQRLNDWPHVAIPADRLGVATVPDQTLPVVLPERGTGRLESLEGVVDGPQHLGGEGRVAVQGAVRGDLGRDLPIPLGRAALALERFCFEDVHARAIRAARGYASRIRMQREVIV